MRKKKKKQRKKSKRRGKKERKKRKAKQRIKEERKEMETTKDKEIVFNAPIWHANGKTKTRWESEQRGRRKVKD